MQEQLTTAVMIVCILSFLKRNGKKSVKTTTKAITLNGIKNLILTTMENQEKSKPDTFPVYLSINLNPLKSHTSARIEVKPL